MQFKFELENSMASHVFNALKKFFPVTSPSEADKNFECSRLWKAPSLTPPTVTVLFSNNDHNEHKNLKNVSIFSHDDTPGRREGSPLLRVSMTTHGDEGKVVRYSEFLAYAIIRRKHKREILRNRSTAFPSSPCVVMN